jgi:hypothetical protein
MTGTVEKAVRKGMGSRTLEASGEPAAMQAESQQRNITATQHKEGEAEAECCAGAGDGQLSVKSFRTMRQRLAPRAPRTANSLLRAAARASSRLERLTQAMRRMTPTADQRTMSER